MREEVILKYTLEDGSIPCSICGSLLLDEITIDHIVPVDEGGETVLSNLQPAHRGCNSSKHSNLQPVLIESSANL